MSWRLGDGQGRVLSNTHWTVQHLINIAEKEKWKSYNVYRSMLQDLHKNHGYLVGKILDDPLTIDKTIDLNKIAGKKYLIKKQDQYYVPRSFLCVSLVNKVQIKLTIASAIIRYPTEAKLPVFTAMAAANNGTTPPPSAAAT